MCDGIGYYTDHPPECYHKGKCVCGSYGFKQQCTCRNTRIITGEVLNEDPF